MSSNFVCSLVTAPTEQDRAVARRVLRSVRPEGAKAWFYIEQWPEYRGTSRDIAVLTAAISGARAGREYAAKLRKADADAAHARVEGHMLDRQALR